MANLAIRTHDFELAKEGLREFSQTNEKDLRIDTVGVSGGLFGLGDHKVTGYEFNNRMSTIQTHLITLNDTNIKTIKEFGKVYNALEALDKDYIQAILAMVEDIRVANEGLTSAHEKIQIMVEDHRKTIEVLKKFKQRLDEYSHIKDIDKIWNDCQKWHKDISELYELTENALSKDQENERAVHEVRDTVEKINKKISDVSEDVEVQEENINEIKIFINKLEDIDHLYDIDEIWDSALNMRNSLNVVRTELDEAESLAKKHQEDIEKALEYIETLSHQEHLHDIDAMWAMTESNVEKLGFLEQKSKDAEESLRKNRNEIVEVERTYSEQIKGLEEKDGEKLRLIQSNRESSDHSFAEVNKKLETLFTDDNIHSEQIKELQAENEENKELIKNNKKLSDDAFTEVENKEKAMMLELSKKIKYAYWIAGVSLALAIAEMVIFLVR